MNTTTLQKKEYKDLVRRQSRVEKELAMLSEVIKQQAEDGLIRLSTLKKWERISRDLDRGGGRIFNSRKEVKSWFKNL